MLSLCASQLLNSSLIFTYSIPSEVYCLNALSFYKKHMFILNLYMPPLHIAQVIKHRCGLDWGFAFLLVVTDSVQTIFWHIYLLHTLKCNVITFVTCSRGHMCELQLFLQYSISYFFWNTAAIQWKNTHHDLLRWPVVLV